MQFKRVIRPSTLSLFSRCWPEEKGRQFYEASTYWLHSDDPGEILVYLNDVGYEIGITGWAPIPGNRAFLRWTAVNPQFRGQGIGRRMIELLMERIRKEYGVGEIYETTDSEEVRDWFLSMGFLDEPKHIHVLELKELAGDFKYCLFHRKQEQPFNPGETP